jgi:hypothetical protein
MRNSRRSHLRHAVALLGLLLTTASLAHAQSATPSGAEVWDRFGCWNCHGSDGHTNMSRAGRPSIAKTVLPLRRFVAQVRLPVRQMPPHPAVLASDSGLAIAYHWLGGIDDVADPPAVTLDLESSPEADATGRGEARVEIQMTAMRAQTSRSSDFRDLASLAYRVTLITNSSLSEADRTLEFQLPEPGAWSKVVMSEDGEALLGQDRHFVSAKEGTLGEVRARLRMTRPTVQTLVVIEAVDRAQSAHLVILGVATVMLKVCCKAT